MGEYMGSSIFHSSVEKCPKCGMKKSKSTGCCKDEKQTLKLQQEVEKLNQDNFFYYSFVNHIPTPFLNYNFEFSFNKAVLTEKFQLPPPPLISSLSLHILNCIFRI